MHFRQAYETNVFLNVPFDQRYRKLLDALVFAIHECGFSARCAMERDDGGEIRVEKIFEIIQECRYGIHDLSRTTLDTQNRLPRFNMPLELGLFLGARRFGSRIHGRKVCLILDRERYRYQKFCSDIAGQDIRAHSNAVDRALGQVRNWLSANSNSEHLPGPAAIEARYVSFRRDLPRMCSLKSIRPSELTFNDYRNFVQGWIESG